MICNFDSWINVNGQLNVQAALPPEKEPYAPHLTLNTLTWKIW